MTTIESMNKERHGYNPLVNNNLIPFYFTYQSLTWVNTIIGYKYLEHINSFGSFQCLWKVESLLEMELFGQQNKSKLIFSITLTFF